MWERTQASGEAGWALAVLTLALRSEIVRGMQPPNPQVLFRESIHDLASEPTIENARRYLAASRLLEAQGERREDERKP
jgi:hypothetical protein